MDIETITALANGYRDAISTANRYGLTPRHVIESSQHPKKEECLHLFDSI